MDDQEESEQQLKIWKQIRELDFSTVRAKLVSRKSWWWNWWADLDKIENEYRQFLFLIAINPGKTVVPWSQDLDDFWHEHILDTGKYTSECQAIFGKYIHHNPHLPVGTPEQKLAFAETKDMYRKAFGGRSKNKKSSAGAAEFGSSANCEAGCATIMPIVFCSSPSDSSPSCSSPSPSCSSPSCGGGSSCSSCGSSCGGGGCGGD